MNRRLNHRDIVEAIEGNFFDKVGGRLLAGRRYERYIDTTELTNYAACFLYYEQCMHLLKEFKLQVNHDPVSSFDSNSYTTTIKTVLLNSPSAQSMYDFLTSNWSQMGTFRIGITLRELTEECAGNHPQILYPDPHEQIYHIHDWNLKCFPGFFEDGYRYQFNGVFYGCGQLHVVAIRGTQNNIETDPLRMFKNVGAIIYYPRVSTEFDFISRSQELPEIWESHAKAHWFIAAEES